MILNRRQVLQRVDVAKNAVVVHGDAAQVRRVRFQNFPRARVALQAQQVVTKLRPEGDGLTSLALEKGRGERCIIERRDQSLQGGLTHVRHVTQADDPAIRAS